MLMEVGDKGLGDLMHRKFIITLLVFLFALSGCAQRINVKKATPGNLVLSPGEDVLIFGRIRWIQNGKEIEKLASMDDIFITRLKISLQIIRVEDKKTGILNIEKDGRFFTILPSGSYIIHRIDWMETWGRNWLVPQIAFSVEEGQQCYYLGTIAVNVKTERTILGTPILKGLEVYIDDEEGEAMQNFDKRYSNLEWKVVKALMIHDLRIPRMIELENQKRIFDVLQPLLFGIQIMTIQ